MLCPRSTPTTNLSVMISRIPGAISAGAQCHSGVTSVVKALAMISVGNTASSLSMNSSSYSSEKRIAPSSRSSSSRNSLEMRGQSLAATLTRCQSSLWPVHVSKNQPRSRLAS